MSIVWKYLTNFISRKMAVWQDFKSLPLSWVSDGVFNLSTDLAREIYCNYDFVRLQYHCFWERISSFNRIIMKATPIKTTVFRVRRDRHYGLPGAGDSHCWTSDFFDVSDQAVHFVWYKVVLVSHNLSRDSIYAVCAWDIAVSTCFRHRSHLFHGKVCLDTRIGWLNPEFYNPPSLNLRFLYPFCCTRTCHMESC